LLTRQVDSPALLAAHVRLLISDSHPSAPAAEKVMRYARKYTAQQPQASAVWLARLEAERRYSTKYEITEAWKDARRSARGAQIEEVWVWGLEQDLEGSGEKDLQVLEVSKKVFDSRHGGV